MEINVRFSKFVDKTDENGKVLINPKNNKPLKTVVSTTPDAAELLNFTQQSVDVDTLIAKLQKAQQLGFVQVDINSYGVQLTKGLSTSITKF